MRIPESPPAFSTLLSSLVSDPSQLTRVLSRWLTPEVGGRYLPWDDVRRREPPDGLTHEQWWVALSIARQPLRTQLPLWVAGRDATFTFARTDSLYRALHEVDRRLGAQLEPTDPALAKDGLRDHYIIRSLAEEAITSSQLEGASTTRRVAKDMLLSGREPRTPSERMISNNFLAMSLLRERQAEPLTPAFILELHDVLTRDTLLPSDVGRLRHAGEPVTVQEHATGQVLHVPPPAEELPQRLRTLCSFANAREDDVFIHPVVRASLLHFMLAYDHPFVDGNGRTARALFYWHLLHRKYWLAEFLSISRIIQKSPAKYSRAFLLSESDEADATYFVLYQLNVLQEAITDFFAYLERKGKELQQAERLLKDPARFNPRQEKLLAHALRHPSDEYTIEAHKRDHGVAYDTARNDLLALAEAGFLEKLAKGRKFVFAAGPELLKVQR